MMGILEDGIATKRLNLACGQNGIDGWLNIDKLGGQPPFNSRVIKMDADSNEFMELPNNYWEHIYCHGAINDFQRNVTDTMNRLWVLLCNGGILEIGVVVTDNGNQSPFQEPNARRYLNSGWIEWFHDKGTYYNYPMGFLGRFKLLSNEISNGVQRVKFQAVKTT